MKNGRAKWSRPQRPRPFYERGRVLVGGNTVESSWHDLYDSILLDMESIRMSSLALYTEVGWRGVAGVELRQDEKSILKSNMKAGWCWCQVLGLYILRMWGSLYITEQKFQGACFKIWESIHEGRRIQSIREEKCENVLTWAVERKTGIGGRSVDGEDSKSWP